MKKNSIEEDIARIAKLITTKFNNDYSIDNKDKEAIEHILSDYKRVLKENKKIRNGRNRLFEYATAQQTTPEMLNKILREDYIPKDKIEEILDETEKKYLAEVIRPFRKRIQFIQKKKEITEINPYLRIVCEDNDKLVFPYITDNSMYKGMEVNKKYTLKELGL